MITIDQLLESVDLDFEPEFVTKDKDGLVIIWAARPSILKATASWENDFCEKARYSFLKLSEFDGRDWTECIYEVPRKTTGKIERFVIENDRCGNVEWWDVVKKINELVDAVNELKEKATL